MCCRCGQFCTNFFVVVVVGGVDGVGFICVSDEVGIILTVVFHGKIVSLDRCSNCLQSWNYFGGQVVSVICIPYVM